MQLYCVLLDFIQWDSKNQPPHQCKEVGNTMHCVSMHFAVFYIALHNAITKYCIVRCRAVQSVMGFVYSSLYHLESCRSAKYTFVSSKMNLCLLFIFSKRLIFFNLVRLMCGGFANGVDPVSIDECWRANSNHVHLWTAVMLTNIVQQPARSDWSLESFQLAALLTDFDQISSSTKPPARWDEIFWSSQDVLVISRNIAVF